jgi:hypothetical protein
MKIARGTHTSRLSTGAHHEGRLWQTSSGASRRLTVLAGAVFMRQTTHSFLFEWINWRIRHNEMAREIHAQEMQL